MARLHAIITLFFLKTLSKIFIIAGEASGDTYGAELMQAFFKKVPGVHFMGLGGPKMAKAAATTGGVIEDWAAEAGVVGLWDVLKKYRYFQTQFARLLQRLGEEQPEAILLIDYPGFNLRLAKAIRKRKLPINIFYFISPQVWAWNRRRIPKMARLLDLMLCIFPFEKELYESSGLPTTFVGHPLVERLRSPSMMAQRLPREENLLGLFPGSRGREVSRIFPVMLEAAKKVMAANSSIRCEAAAASPAQLQLMKKIAEQQGVEITITAGHAYELMQRATFGFVCSGTATLEAACFALPYALIYKVAWLTYVVGRVLIRIPYLGIINILANKPVVKELIQQEATAGKLACEALYFINNPEACRELSASLTTVVERLDSHGSYERAVEAMLEASS